MMSANQPIAVTMTAGEWQNVLLQLSEGPYKIVAPLLLKIQTQALAADQPPASAANGELAAHAEADLGA
jgi:hypothetical protein